MARKHHKPEKIVAKLRQVEVLVGRQACGRRGASNRGDGSNILPVAI